MSALNCVFVVYLSLQLQYATSDLRRIKKVINGTPFNGRPPIYSAVRYYGAVGNAHGTSLRHRDRLDIVILCSGVLIAPIILQTACHCYATFDVDRKSLINDPTVNKHWEGKEIVIFGVSYRLGEDSFQTYSPVLTERFLIHSRCGRIANSSIITYDFGLAQLDRKWTTLDVTSYPWSEIRFAPLKTIQELEDYELYALRQQLVCLHIGFGYYIRGSPRWSYVLRHGWQILLGEPHCIAATTHNQKYSRRDIIPYISWICTANFTKHGQEPGQGDSGGPVTCGNHYVALTSGTTWLYDAETPQIRFNIVTHHSALTYDLVTSAAEFRRDLIGNFHNIPERYP